MLVALRKILVGLCTFNTHSLCKVEKFRRQNVLAVNAGQKLTPSHSCPVCLIGSHHVRSAPFDHKTDRSVSCVSRISPLPCLSASHGGSTPWLRRSASPTFRRSSSRRCATSSCSPACSPGSSRRRANGM